MGITLTSRKIFHLQELFLFIPTERKWAGRDNFMIISVRSRNSSGPRGSCDPPTPAEKIKQQTVYHGKWAGQIRGCWSPLEYKHYHISITRTRMCLHISLQLFIYFGKLLQCSAVCCTLSSMCCTLSAMCCTLSAVCCTLSAVQSTLIIDQWSAAQ